jgi:hypothetical protein
MTAMVVFKMCAHWIGNIVPFGRVIVPFIHWTELAGAQRCAPTFLLILHGKGGQPAAPTFPIGFNVPYRPLLRGVPPSQRTRTHRERLGDQRSQRARRRRAERL